MIFCISGPSGVGKSSVARSISSALSLPLRSCGDAIRERAQQIGVAPAALPDDVHREVDAETLAWAIRHGRCLVEGRFLDSVFSTFEEPWSLVVFKAPVAARTERLARRLGSTFSRTDLMLIDAEDASFRSRIYGRYETTTPWLTVDTGRLEVEELARCIQKAMSLVDRHT